MNIAMLGWEYPPKISGGLGVASQGLARALSGLGHSVMFFLPHIDKTIKDHNIDFIDVSKIKLDLTRHTITTDISREILEVSISELLLPYLPPAYFRSTIKKKVKAKKISVDESVKLLENISITGRYSDSLQNEIKKYAVLASDHLLDKGADIVHAHDWMTFPAGQLIATKNKIPFVAHVHSTEIDRNGSYANQEIVKIEQKGLQNATLVITVSQSVADRLLKNYHVPKNKIHVIPNGWNGTNKIGKAPKTKKIGFIGRFADQKGPAKFVDIARELLNRNRQLKFSMAGDGYLMESVKNKIEQQNLQKHIELKGFIKPEQVAKWMSGISVLIVPSVSEPFGLVALEAIHAGVPIVISRGAGICEFVPALKQVDHWDIFNFSSSVEELLTDIKAREDYINLCQDQASDLVWEGIGRDVTSCYQSVLK